MPNLHGQIHSIATHMLCPMTSESRLFNLYGVTQHNRPFKLVPDDDADDDDDDETVS